ncbi:hypothetical protein NLM31_38025 [Bradyrhizobium sp. CCGUVB4N]|nr:hypothetical protein [Bradyrhizobium sp. CCGUVB4N]MCP3386195.1 hypothetical protein [Bradyrhizobium sp. CCGUVB4N]
MLEEELEAAGQGLVGNFDVLRSVLSASGDCIKILDLDGRLQFMSEGGKRVMEVEDFGKLRVVRGLTSGKVPETERPNRRLLLP